MQWSTKNLAIHMMRYQKDKFDEISNQYGIHIKTIENIIYNSHCNLEHLEIAMKKLRFRIIIKTYDKLMVRPINWIYKKSGQNYQPIDFIRK